MKDTKIKMVHCHLPTPHTHTLPSPRGGSVVDQHTHTQSMGGVCVCVFMCVKGGVRVGQGMGSVNIFVHHNEDLLHIPPIITARLLSLSLPLFLSPSVYFSLMLYFLPQVRVLMCVSVARRERDERRSSLVFYVYK